MNLASSGARVQGNNPALLRRWRKSILGLTLIWQDEKPYHFTEGNQDIQISVQHRNPTKKLICQKEWRHNQDEIFGQQFTWRLTIKVTYNAPNKKESNTKIDEAEFVKTCAYYTTQSTDMRQEMEKFYYWSRGMNSQLTANDKNYGIYLRCEFSAEIIGV